MGGFDAIAAKAFLAILMFVSVGIVVGVIIGWFIWG